MNSTAGSKKKVSVILPTLNEVQNIPVVYQRVKTAIESKGLDYEIIFVDDNSADGSTELFAKLHGEDPHFKYLIMSRRFGDQACLMAGIQAATGDAVITMDSDLQHPPEDIPRMIDHWVNGFEVVIMTREDVGHNSFFKKWSEILFYKTINALSQSPIIHRFAGFALFDKKVAKALNRFKEADPFLRGLISLVGFNKIELTYKEAERAEGESKYSLYQMFRLALAGITSFSISPLYISLYLGGIAIVLSILFFVYVLVSFIDPNVVLPPGWTSTVSVVLLLSGVQLFSIGIIGIYLSKTFIQSKNRPNYIVKIFGGVDEF